ncbi:MAG: helix-turn-helix domain-containing protein [Candidatus Berkelbacteria bacterium]|nr:helix-turn-helix domain-containing protein [Candidatus Berkelbacteria bacterium]
MTNELLKMFGLNDTETGVYLTVLKAGIISPAEVAVSAGIKRTTVYSAAKELIKRGLIAEDLSRKTARLTAVPPKHLATLVEEEQRLVDEKKKQLSPLIAALEKEAATVQYPVPKIQFIAEEDINRFLRQQTPIWNASAKAVDSTWWGYQDPTLVEQYIDWIETYWQQPSSADMHGKLLSSEAEIEKRVTGHPNREIRFWKPIKEITATSWAVGDYMIMVVTNRSPHYLVEIHDAVIAHNLREFCKGVWTELTKRN